MVNDSKSRWQSVKSEFSMGSILHLIPFSIFKTTYMIKLKLPLASMDINSLGRKADILDRKGSIQWDSEQAAGLDQQELHENNLNSCTQDRKFLSSNTGWDLTYCWKHPLNSKLKNLLAMKTNHILGCISKIFLLIKTRYVIIIPFHLTLVKLHMKYHLYFGLISSIKNIQMIQCSTPKWVMNWRTWHMELVSSWYNSESKQMRSTELAQLQIGPQNCMSAEVPEGIYT